MNKTEYKSKLILLGLSLLMIGAATNYFSAEITSMFLNIDTIPLDRRVKSYSILQTNCAETMIKVISVCADIGGILAIIYGCISKKSSPRTRSNL